MICGNKVKLVAIERSDLKILMDWRNIPGFRKHFREYREISMEMQEKWFETNVNNDQNTIMFAIRHNDSNELLGCCGLCYINWVNKNADLSLYIGFRESYIDNEGFALESCNLLFDYAFKKLNLNKIWTEIYEFDYKKKNLYESIGMKIDGILRENYYQDGKWWNSYIMSILAIEFRQND